MMTQQAMVIHNAIVHAEGDTSNHWVMCEDGKITAIGRHEPTIPDNARVIDAGGKRLLPGFVDVHVHGGNNVDTMDATPDALKTMAQFYAQHGVTSFLATTWTDSRENITAALENAKHCLGQMENGATLRGVHLEGPYLNPKKCGAQNKDGLRESDRRFLSLLGGRRLEGLERPLREDLADPVGELGRVHVLEGRSQAVLLELFEAALEELVE
jgi:N-acetylglucosamine-6-phosphate deacetylase